MLSRLCLWALLGFLNTSLLKAQTNDFQPFRILAIRVQGGIASVTVNSATGLVYRLQSSEALQSYWTDIIGQPGSGGKLTLNGLAAAHESLFRVTATPGANLLLFPATPILSSGAISLPDAVAGSPYSKDISPTGTGSGPYHFQMSGSPPDQIIATLLSNDTANAVVRLSSDGTNLVIGQRRQFTVSVSDSTGTNCTRTYDIRVVLPEPLIFASQLTLKADEPVNMSFAATNGTAPLTWTIAFGELPDGISLLSSGSLEGTPSPDAAELGETGLYTNIIQVADSFIDRVTGNVRPRVSYSTLVMLVRLSYQQNIIPYRPDGPALGGVCVGCHGPTFPPDFSSGRALSLIDVNAGTGGQCDGSYTYVIPSDPFNSLLYQKLSGPMCGAQMPQGGPYFSDLQIGRIARWISELTNGDTD